MTPAESAYAPATSAGLVLLNNGIPALRAAQTPRGVRRLARVLALGLVLLPVVLLAGPWQQNVRGEGRAAAYAPLERRQSIEAPIKGRVTRWWVAEGSSVAKGDPLFEITDNDPQLLQRLSAQLATAKAKLEAAQEKVRVYGEQVVAVKEAQGLALRAAQERVLMAEQSIVSAEQALEAADIAHLTAKLNYDRRVDLRKDGLASVREYELARLAVRKAAADLAHRKASLASARNNKAARLADQGKAQAEFEAKIRSSRASRNSAASDAASAQGKILEAETKLARQETQRVLSPMDGTVFRLLGNQGGEMVKAGDPLVVLVPETAAMAVELWVKGNDMPLLSVGRKARVAFEGWPAVQFAGWPSVAVGTFGGVVTLIDATDDGKGRFRVLVQPDPEDMEWPSRRYLRQGVRARAWILLEEVSLGFEFWRQINGFPPVISSEEPEGGKTK